jgi:hypothetical protein
MDAHENLPKVILVRATGLAACSSAVSWLDWTA